MCIIIACRKGTDKNSDKLLDAIRVSGASNTHGSGYMVKYHKDNRVYIHKGFFDTDKLIADLAEKNLKMEDELIIHHRIGTSGKRNSDNCHPFVLAPTLEEVIKNEGFVEYPTMAHNGVFYDFQKYNSDYSDTFHFVRQFMSIPEFSMLLKRDAETFSLVMKDVIRTNKLAFLFPDSDLQTIGEFIEDDGVLYSNKTYKSKEWVNVGGREVKAENFNSSQGGKSWSNPSTQTGGRNNGGITIIKGFQTKVPSAQSEQACVARDRETRSPLLSNFKVTSTNAEHVVLVARRTYGTIIEGGRYLLKNYDSNTLFNFLIRETDKDKSDGTSVLFLTYPTIKIDQDFYMYPRKEFVNVYNDYLKIKGRRNLSHTSLKKLFKYLSRHHNKTSIKLRNLGEVLRQAAVIYYEEGLAQLALEKEQKKSSLLEIADRLNNYYD